MATSPEQMLISAILRTQDQHTPLARGLSPEFFHAFRAEYGYIVEYIERRGRVPDKAHFKQRFPDFVIFKADDVEHYVEEVRTEHVRMKLKVLLNGSVREMMNEEPIDRVLAKMSHEVMALQTNYLAVDNHYDLLDSWEETYNEVADRVQRNTDNGIAGIPTGFATLDTLTGGWSPGTFNVIAARLGQGKTWTMIRSAAAALGAGYVAQYDALEQSRGQVAMRLHTFLSAQHSKEVFKAFDLMTGRNVDLKAYKAFLEDLKDIVPTRLYIADTSRGLVNPMTVAAQIERNQPDIVFVDYLTLMEQSLDGWEGIKRLSAQMQQVAGRYGIPVVVAAQINRTGIGNHPPGPEALSGSDAIGHDADLVLTLKQQSKSVIKFRLAKYRHGRDGDMWYAKFRPNTGDFHEVSGNEADLLKQEDIEAEDAE